MASPRTKKEPPRNHHVRRIRRSCGSALRVRGVEGPVTFGYEHGGGGEVEAMSGAGYLWGDGVVLPYLGGAGGRGAVLRGVDLAGVPPWRRRRARLGRREVVPAVRL